MESLEAALDSLKLSESVNYAKTAKEHKVDANTLRRRHKGIQQSRQDADFQYKTLLTKQQERELVNYINKLTARGLPPTPAMVRNFAYDIGKRWPGKNWVSEFQKRQKSELHSGFLVGADLNRKKADNIQDYQAYFELVSNLISIYFHS